MNPSNLEILAYEQSSLGPLCLRRRELLSSPGTVVTEVTLNHEFLMSSYYTVSETALSRLALELHAEGTEPMDRPLRVLIGGLGLGYTAHAALESSGVGEVVVVERLPEVAGWLEDDLLPLSETLKADRRFRTEVGDFFERLSSLPEALYDLVLVDIDHAPDHHLHGSSAGFYTTEGLEGAKAHLTPDGVLAVWSSADSPEFRTRLAEAFHEVRAEPVPFYNELVHGETTDWIFLARSRG